MKKVLCAISAATLLSIAAPSAFATSIGDDMYQFLAVDQLAAMTFQAPSVLSQMYNGGASAGGGMNTLGEDSTRVAVLTGAINYNHIDASVVLNASKINLTGVNSINTTAIGAMVGGVLASTVEHAGNLGGTDVQIETNSYVVSVGVMNAAINTNHIDANVNITMNNTNTGLFTTAAGELTAANLAITTVAVGAINNSLTKVGVKVAAVTLP